MKADSNSYRAVIADLKEQAMAQKHELDEAQCVVDETKRRLQQTLSLLEGLEERQHELYPDNSALAHETLDPLDRIQEFGAQIVMNQLIPSEAFRGRTIADAAVRYLSTVMQSKTVNEIAQALEEGGMEHNSLDFVGTVRTTLAKHAAFTRINNTWALTAWKMDLNAAPAKKFTLEQKILKAIGSEPGSVWLPRRMALAIHANLNSVQSMMSAMAQSGILHKEPRGYSLPKSKPQLVDVSLDRAAS